MASLPRDFLASNLNLTEGQSDTPGRNIFLTESLLQNSGSPRADLWLLKIFDVLIVCLLFLRGEAGPLSRMS